MPKPEQDEKPDEEQPEVSVEPIEPSEAKEQPKEPTESAKADEIKKPTEPLPAIPLKVFVKIAGPKWDQMAGFISYAKLQKMGPRSVPEWRATYQAFLRKPVR